MIFASSIGREIFWQSTKQSEIELLPNNYKPHAECFVSYACEYDLWTLLCFILLSKRTALNLSLLLNYSKRSEPSFLTL